MTIKQRFLIFLLGGVTVAPFSVFSCDMHGGGGYGFSPFGPRYAMHDRYETKSKASPESQLSVKHDRFLSVTSGAPSVLTIEYQVPNSFIDVKLRFSSDKDINLIEEPEVTLTKSSGVYKLHFASLRTGEQRIKVHITALGEATSIDEERSVVVRSI